ncbi:YdcF family protein [Roseivirga sp. UBA838]|uniref:YdcF family protein n=1 Tax=Roseivirga sp. UBA838 TaxID=1947393 RepID=UPI00257A3267|nr:YdcF family protein [Roseivirga sp. UBA838]|tara:strand:- start:57613 stop:58377 length:765 start_codon:yes stop_codon:yes gene_type:complete
MFFILSKILSLFVGPLTWVIGLLILSVFLKNSRWKKRCFWLSVGLLAFFSNQYIANRVMLWWEPEPVPMKEMAYYDVAVVFSGVTKGSKTPRDRIYFNMGADRITHTLQLYNEGKIGRILVSGGLGFEQVDNSRAADRLKSFLTMAGVPDSVIVVEPHAINTHENAVKSAELLNSHFPGQNYLLITSAFHMKRASLCLKRQGVDFDTFPAGYLTDRSTLNFDDLVIPRASAIDKWETLFKEWVGLGMYRVMGYI